jgi:hypothetical protein
VSEYKKVGVTVISTYTYLDSRVYLKRLQEGGFTVTEISLNPRYTPLPGSLVDWLRTFARTSFLSTLSDEEAEEVMDEVEQACTVDGRDADGNWAMMYVRLRFIARST